MRRTLRGYAFVISSVGLLVCGLGIPADAQQIVGEGDIRRLQDYVDLAERDIRRLRSKNAESAEQLEEELDELRDEAIYLKIKLRKEGSLPRAEYADVRDRIQDLRSRTEETPTPSAPTARSLVGTTATTTSPGPTESRGTTRWRNTVEIPSGTEIDVRLSNSLSSATANVEARFEATTLEDLTIEERVVVPAGSVVRGVIIAVERATRTNRRAKMTVSFDQVTVHDRAYPFRGTVTEAIESEGLRGEAGRIGVGAGVGGILGGLLGGFKGALAGILIGGGGTIAATEGREVELPQGSVLRMRIDSPMEIHYRTGL